MRFALVIAVAVSACSHPNPPPAPAPSPAPERAATVPPAKPAAPAPVTFAGVPETPAGKELGWVLGTIVHGKGVVTKAELEAKFTPAFLTAVPAEQMVTLFGQLGEQLAMLQLVSVKGDELHAIAHVTVGPNKLRVTLELDPASRRIAGLLLRPDGDEGPKPKTFDEAMTMTTALAPRAQLLVASLDKGTCKPLHRAGGKEPLAIASTVKLYVLLGLVDRILAGKATWDDELAVRDDWKSLPSGMTQKDAAGTKLTLREYATRMISISDNTATDHLLYTLGRDKIEAAMRSTKHTNPRLNVPFISTRELFLFKLGMPADELDGYRKLDEKKRRAFLDTQLAGKVPDITHAANWQKPRRIDELEWFATSEDLCRAMGTLWQRAQKPKGKDLLDVLAKNPGVPIDTARWPYVGYKGGSEPGVLNLTWLLQRSDKKWFVVVLTANAVDGHVEEPKATAIASGVIELLGAD